VPFSQSERLVRAYQEMGLDAQLVKVEGAKHDFEPVSSKAISVSLEEIHKRTVAFFAKLLTQKRQESR
jgi:hypothetical protein